MPFSRSGLVFALLSQGRNDEAMREAEDFIALRPQMPDGYSMAGVVASFGGDFDGAKRHLERAVALAPTQELALDDRTRLGFARLKTGEAAEGRALLERALEERLRLIESSDENWSPSYNAAATYAALGDTGEALTWLQKAIESGFLAYRMAEWDPMLESLHGNARFEAMMTELRARVADMRRRVREEGWSLSPVEVVP